MIVSLVFVVCFLIFYVVVKMFKVMVMLVSVELVENNLVGNEWVIGVSVNGKNLKEGLLVILNLKLIDMLKLKVEVEEQDMILDIGSKSVNVKVFLFFKLINKIFFVVVKENRGCYLGNMVIWEFKFKISKK